jgi:hypothetical protein
MKVLIAVVSLMLVCAVANAQESTVESQMMADQAVAMIESPSTTCTKGNLSRVVEITYGGEQGKAPCEVHYKKVTEDPTYDRVIYDARHKSGYCEEKKREFVEKLSGMGWDCS